MDDQPREMSEICKEMMKIIDCMKNDQNEMKNIQSNFELRCTHFINGTTSPPPPGLPISDEKLRKKRLKYFTL